MITSDNPRLSYLHARAERLGLQYTCLPEFDTFLVDSSRLGRPPHYVIIRGEGYICDCEAATQAEPLACTHVSLIVAHREPLIFVSWLQAGREALQKFRLKIVTGAPLALSEKRRLNKSVKEFEARPTPLRQLPDFDEAVSVATRIEGE